MHERKLFVGAGIRRLRDSRSMTQADLAAQLRISTAYLSQMETNQRPVSALVLYGLSQLFGAEAANLMSEDPDRLAADLREALSDPLFSHSETNAVDIRALALSAPWLAHRFIELAGAFRHALEPEERESAQAGANFETGKFAADNFAASKFTEARRPVGAHPFEVVRDFFHYNDNYIDELDQAAEQLAGAIFEQRGRENTTLEAALHSRLGVRVREMPEEDARIRLFDPRSRVLSLGAGLDPATRAFQLAYQLARLENGALIDRHAEDPTLRGPEARALWREWRSAIISLPPC